MTFDDIVNVISDLKYDTDVLTINEVLRAISL